MENLLISPPMFQPTGPYLAIPALMAQLEQAGFEVEALDLNIEFYNEVLQKTYLEKSIKKVEEIEEKIQKEAKKYNSKRLWDYPIKTREIILKNKIIQTYLETKSDFFKIIPNEIDKAVAAIKNKEEFYNPQSYKKSIQIISAALEIASLPYAPTNVFFPGHKNPLLSLDYDVIKYNTSSKSTNIYIEFFEKWVKKIKEQKPKFVGISIASYHQMLAGLTLARMLKKETNAYIAIGGSYFTRTLDTLSKCPDFFDTFAQAVLFESGENSIVELLKFLNKELPIEKVSNIIYKQKKKIITNNIPCQLEISETQLPSYKGFDFSKYLTPDVILQIQTARGCYWGKCSFCDIPYGKTYSIKKIDKVIEEIKNYTEKYKINHFEIVDESLNPYYLNELSKELINNNLQINYKACSRIEDAFSKELLNQARESGLRLLQWGLETGSERIFRLINKSENFSNRIDILRNSAEADIWNNCFLFFSFPTETMEEAQETINLINANTDIINSVAHGHFSLAKYSHINKNQDFYKIKSIKLPENNFEVFLNFEGQVHSKEEKKELIRQLKDVTKKIGSDALERYFPNRDYLFLYISHYGMEWVKNFIKSLQEESA